MVSDAFTINGSEIYLSGTSSSVPLSEVLNFSFVNKFTDDRVITVGRIDCHTFGECVHPHEFIRPTLTCPHGFLTCSLENFCVENKCGEATMDNLAEFVDLPPLVKYLEECCPNTHTTYNIALRHFLRAYYDFDPGDVLHDQFVCAFDFVRESATLPDRSRGFKDSFFSCLFGLSTPFKRVQVFRLIRAAVSDEMVVAACDEIINNCTEMIDFSAHAGLLESIIDAIKGFWTHIVHWFDVRARANDFITFIRDTILRTIKDGIQDLLTIVYEAIISFVIDKTTGVAGFMRDKANELKNTPAFRVFVKTLVRLWMQYDVKALLLEIILDRDAHGYLVNVIKSLIIVASDPTEVSINAAVAAKTAAGEYVNAADEDKKELGAGLTDSDGDEFLSFESQANTSPMIGLGAIFMSLFSMLKNRALTDFDLTTATIVFERAGGLSAAFDRIGLEKLMRQFVNWITCTDPADAVIERWRVCFPGTCDFVDAFVNLPEKPLSSQLNDLRYHYFVHLKEIPRFGDETSLLMNYARAATNYMRDQGLCQAAASRRQPSAFIFSGPPGIGKSVLARRLSNILAKKHAQLDNNARASTNDYVYAVQAMDNYASGYANQDIWYFDDLLQRVDSPAAPSLEISLLFSLVTCYPAALNMPALSDKGIKANCSIVVGATNILFVSHDGNVIKEPLKPYIKSSINHTAVRRRLSHVIVPSFKQGFRYDPGAGAVFDPDGKRISLDRQYNPNDMYFFNIIDSTGQMIVSPEKNVPRNFSWFELVKTAWVEYEACLNYKIDSDEDYENELAYLCDSQSSPLTVQEITDFGLCRFPELAVHNRKPSHVTLFKWKNEGSPCCNGERAQCRTVAFPSGVCYCNQAYQVIADEVFMLGDVQPSSDYISARRPDAPELIYPTVVYALVHYRDKPCLYPEEKIVSDDITQGHLDATVLSRKTLFFADFIFQAREGMHTLASRLTPGDWYGIHPVIHSNLYRIQRYISSPLGRAVEVLARAAFVSVVFYATKRIVSSISARVSEAVQTGIDKFNAVRTSIQATLEGWTYDADDNSFSPQGGAQPIVVVNGVRYVVVRRADGTYRLYEESTFQPHGPPDTIYHRAMKKTRFAQQVPAITSNLWAVLDHSGELLGTAFVVNETTILVPYHVGVMMCDGCVLKRDSSKVYIQANLEHEQHVVLNKIDEDLCYVTLYSDNMGVIRHVHGRDLSDKFISSYMDVPKAGCCLLYRRNRDGDLVRSEATYREPNRVSVYRSRGLDYRLTIDQHRFVDAVSEFGWCGGIYLDAEYLAHPVLGFHVAGKTDVATSVMHVFDRDAVRQIPILIPPTGFSYEGREPPKVNIVDLACGAASSSTYTSVRPPVPSRGKTVFPDLTSCGYGMADLSAGAMANALKKFDRGTIRTVSVRDAANKVLAMYEIASQGIDRSDVSIRHALEGCGELGHVNSAAASGKPFDTIGSTKAILFDKEGRLLDEAESFIQDFLDTLAPEDWQTRPMSEFEEFDAICTSSLKEEPRPLEKVEAKKTRLFSVASLTDYCAQRVMFYPFSVLMTQRNIAVESACGLGPEDFGAIHEDFQFEKVLTTDFEFFDASFLKSILAEARRVLIFWFPNDGPTREIPGFGRVNRSNFIRYRLFSRLMHFKTFIGDLIAQLFRSHPSGSFLTTIINILVNSIIWRVVTDDDCLRRFLGDDSVLNADDFDIPMIVEKMHNMGFTVTSDTKGKEIEAYPRWRPVAGTWSKYKFCSRFFAAPLDCGPVIGVLEPDRLLKMLSFSDYKHHQRNFPLQVASFIAEVKLWYRVDPQGEVISKCREVLAVFGKRFFEICMGSPDPTKYITGHVPALMLEMEQSGIPFFAQSKNPRSFVETERPSEICSTPVGVNPLIFQGIDALPRAPPDVFSRLYKIDTVSWSTTQASGLKLSVHHLPGDYFDQCAPMRAKLANSVALRGKMVFKIVISGSPFASGKLLVAARPYGTSPASLSEAYGDCHVELDVNCATTATVVVPTMTPNGWSFVEAYGDTPSRFNWADVSVWVLTPLTASVATTLSVTIFCAIADCDLRGSTITDFGVAVAQAPGEEIEEDEIVDGDGMTASDRALAMNVATPSFGAADTGLMDNYFGKFVRTYSSYVRTIGGAIVDTVAILKVGAIAAVVAGFSLPADPEPSHPARIVFHPGLPNAVGVFPTPRPLLFPTGKIVAHENVFGTGDDMDIVQFCSRAGLYALVPWHATDAAGTILFQAVNNPGVLGIHTHATSYGSLPIGFMSSFFRLWRGTLIWNFSIAKTNMHSGSIEIVLQLGICNSDIYSSTEVDVCNRVIWDISNSNSLDVVCPYNALTPWSIVQFQSWHDHEDLTANFDTPTGMLFARVLSPLTDASGSVVSTVDLVVSVRAGPDFELAIPRGNDYDFYVPPPVPAPRLGKECEFEAHGKEEKEKDGVFGSVASTTVDHWSTPTKITPDAIIQCTGEPVRNLRLLLRRMARGSDIDVLLTPTQSAVVWINWTRDFNYYNMSLENPLLNSFNRVFAFYTGSLRAYLNYIPSVNAGSVIQTSGIGKMFVRYRWGADNLGVPFETDTDPMASFDETDTPIDLPYQFQVPFVHAKSLRNANAQNFWATIEKPMSMFSTSVPQPRLAAKIIAFYGAGDDFSFGWQQGVPDVTVAYGNSLVGNPPYLIW